MAASTALPPARRISRPASVASGFAEAAMWRVAVTVESPARNADDASGWEGRSDCGVEQAARSAATGTATVMRRSRS